MKADGVKLGNSLWNLGWGLKLGWGQGGEKGPPQGKGLWGYWDRGKKGRVESPTV